MRIKGENLVCSQNATVFQNDKNALVKVGPFFHWDSLHARLNSHYEAWSYKEKKHKKKNLQLEMMENFRV